MNEPKYIKFVELETPPDRKTKIWKVVNREYGSHVGTIKWYSPWRKYCFFPVTNTVFEEICLGDIAAFLEEKKKEYKEEKLTSRPKYGGHYESQGD